MFDHYMIGLAMAEAPVVAWAAWKIYRLTREFRRETKWLEREREKLDASSAYR